METVKPTDYWYFGVARAVDTAIESTPFRGSSRTRLTSTWSMKEDEQTTTHETNLAQLSEFARRRPELDPYLLRGALANSLRRRGFASIVAKDDGVALEKKDAFSTLLVMLVLWGFGVSAVAALDLAWYLVPIGVLAAMLAIYALLKVSNESTLAGVLVVLAWFGLGVAEALEAPVAVFVAAYAAPIALAVGYGLVKRLLRLRDAQDVVLSLAGVIKSAPLVAPVVLIVLFLPALSADVWRVASELSPESMAFVGLLSVGLLFLVVRLQLGAEVERVLRSRAGHLTDSPERVALTRAQARSTMREEDAALFDELPDKTIDNAWPNAGEEYAPYLRAAAGKNLEAPLTGRLALTVGVVALLFSAYVYILCLAVVPASVAAAWTNQPPPTEAVEALGLTVNFHGGAYVSLAVLLGLAATATFLSFALVEERFANALTDALLRDPADRLLALALPYISLFESSIDQRHRLNQAMHHPDPHQAAES